MTSFVIGIAIGVTLYAVGYRWHHRNRKYTFERPVFYVVRAPSPAKVDLIKGDE